MSAWSLPFVSAPIRSDSTAVSGNEQDGASMQPGRSRKRVSDTLFHGGSNLSHDSVELLLCCCG